MATMQGYMSGQETQLDELPSWKRDLILRKRANVRMHGGFGFPTPTPSSMAGRGQGSLSGRPPLSCTLSGPPSSVSGPLSSIRGPHLPLIRSVSGPPYSHPYPLNNNAVSPRLEGVREGSVFVVSSGGDGSPNIEICATVKSDIASANVSSDMHHKGLNDEGPRVTSPSFSDTCALNVQGGKDEDFSYGPGIVSKLKNRYMSLAMRDSRSRPALRKFSSLEDLLDDDPRETWQETVSISNVAKPRHGYNNHAQSNHTGLSSHRREVMKRARSVDSLSSRLSSDEGRSSSGRLGLPKSKSATSRLQSSLAALQKDHVIIIEATRPPAKKEQQQRVNGAHTKSVDGGEPPPLTRKMSSSKVTGEPELPAPDTVRHVKKIFEPVGGRALRGTKARVAAHKAAQANHKTNGTSSSPSSKPAIRAKPTDIPPRKITPPAPATALATPAFPVTIEEAKSSLKQVAPVCRASPRATLSVRASALNGSDVVGEESVGGGGGGGGGGVGVGRARPGLTPLHASVTAPLVNGNELPARPAPAATSVESNAAAETEWVEEGVRKISSTAAVSSIRQESLQSQAFDFTSSSSSSSSTTTTTQSSSKVVVANTTTTSKPSSSPTPTHLPASPLVSHRVPPTPADSHLHHTPVSKSDKSQVSDHRVLQENLKNTEKSRGGGGVDGPTSRSFDPHKVDTLRSPTQNEAPPSLHIGPKDPVKLPGKVEPHRSSPPTPGKGHVSKSASPKPEFRQHVVLSPVAEPKSSSSSSPSPFVSDELVRSPGRGSLVEAINKPSASSEGGSGGGSPGLKSSSSSSSRGDWRGPARGQDNNTLVFNFTSSKKETPDYLEYDGVDLSRRIPKSKQLDSGYVYMPDWEGPRDSSTDGDDFDEPGTDYLDARPGVQPPPSGIVFEGEAVIINGRSNLQRQPKTKKQTISFDDSAQTFEYPSEASLIEENLPITAMSSSDLTSTAVTNSSTHGGLASYTPSKIQIGSSFELGVSRTAPPVQASPPAPPVQTERVDEEYLRPADESETVTWSAESTSDMLF